MNFHYYSVAQQALVKVATLKTSFSTNFQQINTLQLNLVSQLKLLQFKLKILLMVKWTEKEKDFMDQRVENVFFSLTTSTCLQNKNMVHNLQFS